MSGKRLRFPRCHRLVKASEFQRVFDQARRLGGRGLVVLACNNNLDYARLGLVISTRHASRAVVRNRIKRLIRENFRLFQARLAGLDVVVIGRKGMIEYSTLQLRAMLEEHWKRLEQWTRP